MLFANLCWLICRLSETTRKSNNITIKTHKYGALYIDSRSESQQAVYILIIYNPTLRHSLVRSISELLNL